MLISLHMPKTAGTSFRVSLEQHFGEKFLPDYKDLPINTPVYERNRFALQQAILNAEREFSGIECIHGHFLPVKYLLMASRRDVTFITWMRDPVERVVSHYFFWRRNYDPATAPRLRKQVNEEDWSLERFCLSPELRDLYTQFLWGFPIEYFEFIGITEYYANDLQHFANRYLNGVPIAAMSLNVGDSQRKGFFLDADLRKRIEAYHSRDMALYQKAIEMRHKRLSG